MKFKLFDKNLYSKLLPHFNIKNYIFIFFVSSFIGWLYETTLSFFKFRHYCSMQCLLYGPFIPVYGLGAVLFSFLYYKVKDIRLFFILSMPSGAILEFLYSYIQEKLVGTVHWNYSSYFINFDGRTSIGHAIFWGIVGVVFIRFILPILFNITKKIPNKLKYVLTYSILVYMIFNFSATFLTSRRQFERNNNIKAENLLDTLIDKYYPDEKLDKKYFSKIRKK